MTDATSAFEARRREFRDAAAAIVRTEGYDSLTLRRLGAELGYSVATVYRYYASKSALLAELNASAVEVVLGAYETARPRWDAHIATADLEPGVEIVVRLVLFADFFADASTAFPDAFVLIRRAVFDDRIVIEPDDVERIRPRTLGLLAIPAELLARGAAAGVIEPGDTFERTVAWAAALLGAMQVEKYSPLSPQALQADRLVPMLSRALLRGWGAPRSHIDTADRIVEEMRGGDSLVVHVG